MAVTATAPPIRPPTGVGWTARLGWGVAAAVFVIFAVVSVANLQSGMHGDPRTTNPDPGFAPYPPFLGVDNWPLVMNTFAVALTIGFFGVAAWLSIRHRRVHWSVIVGIAAFFAGAVDPLANWATFTVFDPRVAHFPVSWPYFDISPLLEPTLSFLGGYAAYYVVTGIGLVRGYERLVEPHLRPSTWLDRHRLIVVLAPLGALGMLRVAGIAKPAYHDEFRYPAVKVYDPYGDLQRAGKPGPFYR